VTRRRWVLIGALVITHLLLHVGFGYGRIAPDFMMVAVLVGARDFHVGKGAALGFFLGLAEDAFSVLSFGANTFALTVLGILSSRSRDLFVGDSLGFVVAYFFLGKWMRDALAWVASDLTSRPPAFDFLLVDAPLGALYVAVCGILMVLLLGGRLDTSE